MNKYPTINYIGNKQKITDWIIECMPVKSGTVLDLFCGGCSVSYALKEHGYRVLSNDVLYSNYVLAKAIIENSKDILEYDDLLKVKDEVPNEIRSRIDFLTNNIYFDYEVDELARLIELSNKLNEYKNFMFLSLLRRAMIRKIPYSRMNVKWEEIQKLRDEEYSYRKYGRYRHYHNVPFMDHIKENIAEYNYSVFNNGRRCKALNFDALDCINCLETKVDVIYMDPPYPSTMNKYNDFYGYYDKMLGYDSKIKLDLTSKDTFLDNFYTLVAAAKNKARYVLISLNNKCYPSCELLSEKLKPLVSKVEIYTKSHVYKVTGKENKNSNYEILMLCKLKGD